MIDSSHSTGRRSPERARGLWTQAAAPGVAVHSHERHVRRRYAKLVVSIDLDVAIAIVEPGRTHQATLNQYQG